MRKTYSFSVQGPEVYDNDSDLVKSLIAQADDDIRQLRLTESINLKVYKEHKQILLDFAGDVVNLFKELGINCKVNTVKTYNKGNNYYLNGVTVSIIRGEAIIDNLNIVIKGKTYKGDEFPDSKYTTYNGKYNIYAGWEDCLSFWDVIRSYNTFDSVDAFIEDNRSRVVGLIKQFRK